MQILTNINPVCIDMGKEYFKSIFLLFHCMTAVINKDIKPGNSTDQGLEETLVFLVPDEDFNPLFFKPLALRVNINAVNAGSGAEIMFPHL